MPALPLVPLFVQDLLDDDLVKSAADIVKQSSELMESGTLRRRQNVEEFDVEVEFCSKGTREDRKVKTLQQLQVCS